MSKHYLRKLDDKMGQAEYEMYRAIPAEEIGWENPAHHMTYDEWREFLVKEIANETQRIIYIMYLEDYPIGLITLVLKPTDDNGNIGYCVRPICRGKNLGVIMLELGIKEARKLNISKLVGQANKHNVASWKAMEKCRFRFINETDWGSKRYELIIEEEK